MFNYEVIAVYDLDGEEVFKLLGKFRSAERLSVSEAVGNVVASIDIMRQPNRILLHANNVFALIGEIEGNVFTEPSFNVLEYEIYLFDYNKQPPKIKVLSAQSDDITDYYTYSFAEINYPEYEQAVLVSKSTLTEIPIEVKIGENIETTYSDDLRVGCVI